MRRIYSEFAYGPGPRAGCWWDETIAAPDWPVLRGDLEVDVAIVGGGFTGVSAALTLAEAGASVAVLEAGPPGWGASGRNGGFCCLGGGRLTDRDLVRRYGADGAAAFQQAERDAVALVATRLERYGIDADRHSAGETKLAHSARAMAAMRAAADRATDAEVTERDDLAALGISGPFHGAVTVPVGFGLNPRKYLFGLARAALASGAEFFANGAVSAISSGAGAVELKTAGGRVRAAQAIVATNGYSSEDVPGWLAGRYLPTQSTVLVTRPLSDAELAAQGWTSDQMCYDSRTLLHYFRLMPDRRFLFGSRGGLRATGRAEAHARARNLRDFRTMFPGWGAVEVTNQWSGMVCLSRNAVPFVEPLPGLPGVHAALAYHGNGVAMGSWAGTALARSLVSPRAAASIPGPMRRPATRFPLGRARRLLLPPAYLAYRLGDML